MFAGRAIVGPMKRYSEAQRVGFVTEHERSGLGAAEFCRRRGISTVSLANWRRRHGRRKTAQPPDASRWLPVSIAGPVAQAGATQQGGYVLRLADARLEVPRGFDPDEVRALWRLLQADEGGEVAS